MRDSTQPSILLAAQPIYDRHNKSYGVELLYRNDLNQSALDVGDQHATSELLFNFCTGITEQVAQYHSPAFINVSASFLQSTAFLPIDPSQVVIELVERIKPSAELIAAVSEWHSKGFTFALDDFDFSPEWEPLLNYTSIIKVDVETINLDQLEKHRDRLKHYHFLWLAERIEDETTKNAYMDAGFDLFQGYYFAKPIPVYGKKMTGSVLQLTKIIGSLYCDEPDVDKLTQELSADPDLAISLIRVANSPLYKVRTTITSLREVVMRLGLDHLRRWVILIGFLNASAPETARIILIRAQACYDFAKHLSRDNLDPDQAFLVGLLSGVDVLLRIEKAVFIENAGVSDEVIAAVLSSAGIMGQVLEKVLQIEVAVCMKKDLETLHSTALSIYQGATVNVQNLLNHVA